MTLVTIIPLLFVVTCASGSLDIISLTSDVVYRSMMKFNDIVMNTRSDESLFELNDADMGRTTPQVIVSRGFYLETHHIHTVDGYILGIHRLINVHKSSGNKKMTGRRKKLKPVILHHGLLGSSIDFVINSPGGCVDEDPARIGNNLAFELAKRDYDVWLANSRGNMYSLNHVKYKSSDPAYWNFSLDEHIQYDLPAVIDYIKETVNSSTLAYVGHSQGTSIMFALLAIRPEYSTTIKPFIALAPVATAQHITSPVSFFSQADFLVNILSKKTGPFLPDSLVRWLSRRICNRYFSYLCGNTIFFIVGGFDSPQLNFTRVPVYTSTESYGTSIKNIVHWSQLIGSEYLRHFDYGKKGNLLHYGQADAPIYPLDKINSTHIAIFSSLNDGFVSQVDVDRLRQLFKGQLLDDYVVPYKLWSHLDFIWAMQAGEYINRRVMRLLNLHA